MARFLELEDVVETAARYPESFFIPPEEERRSQKVGDSVRLHFHLKDPVEDEPRAERMWVRITQALDSDGTYKGILESSPVAIEDLHLGDEVTFEPRHIARTIIEKGDPRWIDSHEQKALVSKLCLERGECVRFLYRESADREEDSGWRMFTGHESESYTEDPDNIAIVNVGWMLDRDPTLLVPLKQGVGAVFEREDKGAMWQSVTDWSPPE